MKDKIKIWHLWFYDNIMEEWILYDSYYDKEYMLEEKPQIDREYKKTTYTFGYLHFKKNKEVNHNEIDKRNCKTM